MDPLRSWIVVVWMVVGVAWVTIQYYRLSKWKEEMGDN